MNLPIEGELSPGGELTDEAIKEPRRFGDLQKTITMAQIAKAAGVSQGAISSLLNDRDYGIRVSEKTRERVFKVCREMGYIPNDLRAVVRMYPEFGDFCLLVSTRYPGGLANPFVARSAQAALDTAASSSCSFTVAFYDDQLDYSADPETLPSPIRTGVASKFIVLGRPNLSLFQTLLRRGSPVVSLGFDMPVAGVLSLVPDYQAASHLALEHLVELGHTHIGIASGPFGATEPQIIEINRGVSLACEHLGIVLDAQNIIHGDLSFQAGVAAFESLSARSPAPSAVFCLSDALAAGLIAAAQAHGLRVPADLSVIGCGDDAIAQMSAPSLTTIHIPVEEMAHLAIHTIDRLVADASLREAKKEFCPVRLLQRQSAAPPKSA